MKLKYRFMEGINYYFTDEKGKWYCRSRGNWYRDTQRGKCILDKRLLKELERQYEYWRAEEKLKIKKD